MAIPQASDSSQNLAESCKNTALWRHAKIIAHA